MARDCEEKAAKIIPLVRNSMSESTGKWFKGHLLCKIHFYMSFVHKWVLAVCEHNHPTMIKIHPLLIFNPY